MNPEVVQDHPGDRPKCGMSLEPRTIVPESDEDDAELRDMTRRFRWGALLTLPLFVVAMAHPVPAWRQAEAMEAYGQGQQDALGFWVSSSPIRLPSGRTGANQY